MLLRSISVIRNFSSVQGNFNARDIYQNIVLEMRSRIKMSSSKMENETGSNSKAVPPYASDRWSVAVTPHPKSQALALHLCLLDDQRYYPHN